MSMSRADEVRAAFAAELALAEAEDRLIQLKESGTPEELAEHKLHVRGMRRAFREERAGAATASPATIDTVTDLRSPGGEA
jgi:hypothetical protein